MRESSSGLGRGARDKTELPNPGSNPGSRFHKNKMKKWTKLEIEALVLNYEGVSARDLSIETGRSIRAIIQKAKKLGLKSKLRNKGNNQDNKGSNNPNFGRLKTIPTSKGIHGWVRKHKPKPKICGHCKKEKRLTLANMKNHNYTRDIKDYEWLCYSCHKIMDNSKRDCKNTGFK